MRVLMTADTVGGVWTYALELAGALAPHGVEIALATMGAPLTPAQREEVGGHPNVELFESSYRLEWMEEPWDDLERAGEWLFEVAARFRPDLVHLNGYHHAALPWGAPVVVVAHSCVLTWWRAVKGEVAPGSWERYREGVARGLEAADQVVAPTAALLTAMREHYGPLPGARVVPNARSPARFLASRKEPFILGAGRIWDEAKDLALLVELAPSLSWPVYLAGAVEHPGRSEGQGADRGADGAEGAGVERGGARYLGRLAGAELARWLGRAALFALPARYEPFGLSAVEAGLSGCALVLGDIPSQREVWGDAAYFVPPGDAGALRRALEGLGGDLAARSELAVRARRRALEYAPARQAAGYLAVYGAALEGRSEGACA
jgi:glycosyltransferase involved in cell wall biosynthesis